jgi:hypothetical protein
MNHIQAHTFPMSRFMAKATALLCAGMVLASCYMPVRFDSEITLDRKGYYDLKFEGYLAEMTLYQGLVQKKISPAEEKEKAAIIERDFTRDADVKEFSYFREGHFKVRWERAGDLIEAKTVTFLRRNELILQLQYIEKSGTVVLEGKSLKKENRDQIAKIGLNMQGQIRFKTDMKIINSNATSKKKDPKDPRFTWLVWDIESIYSPRPHATFAF